MNMRLGIFLMVAIQISWAYILVMVSMFGALALEKRLSGTATRRVLATDVSAQCECVCFCQCIKNDGVLFQHFALHLTFTFTQNTQNLVSLGNVL